jgi:putative ABC transport system substrate-binding protein
VIATAGSSAFAVKEATATVPIVCLVASLAQPGGNLTGINFFAGELAAKRLELMRQLVPAATRVAVLVNPAYASMTEITLKDVELAARATGLQTQVLNANTSSEIDAAFEIIEHLLCSRANLSWSSMHRLRGCFASRYLQRCWPSPTR